MSLPRRLLRLPPFPTFAADVLGLDPGTRGGHLVIAKALDGLPLDDNEVALFRVHTGREVARVGGYPFALTLTGRQSGKSEQAAARLVYAAVAAAIGGLRDIACVGMSQDVRAAVRVLFGYCVRFFEQPLLRGLVVNQTVDTITLTGGVRILVLPCRPASIRGLRCACVCLDEICHFRSTEGNPLDREAWRAALPTILTVPGAKLFALSSPYVASGLAFDLHSQHYGVDADVLVWRSSALTLHPGLSDETLAQIRAADPDGASAEIDGEFLRHVSALLDDEAITAAVDAGVTSRRRVGGHCVHVDVATGSKATGDRWAVAAAHQDGGVAVLDGVLVIAPPFSPESAAQQTASFCRGFDVRTVRGDRFAAGFSGEAFARAGLKWEPAERSTSEAYLEFAAALASGRVRLLDQPDLLAELRGLERRRGATRDRVDHRRGLHDDAACAAVGALVAVTDKPAGPTVRLIMPTVNASNPRWREQFF